MKKHTQFLGATAYFVASTVFAQHTDHADHGIPAADEIGSQHVLFQTSCAPAVADDFNRGVALLHSFWFAEAIAVFNHVLSSDPDCAMAYWGIASSHWGNPFAGQRNAPQMARGQEAVARAQSTGSPSAKDTAYINAVAHLFADDQATTQSARALAYEAAMDSLTQAYPEDMEAKIFHALAINQTASPTDKTYAQQLRAAQILEPLFMEHPYHPGLAHYIIHAYDHPPLAEKALNAARRYASLAPAVPHALHMPSHTFTRVGLWQESIDTNQRSAEAARANDGVGEELHALDYQAYAYLQMARDVEAKAVLDRALALTERVNITAVGATAAGAFAIAAIPARFALEREDFAAAAQLPVNAAGTPHTMAITHFARALGAARSGVPAAAAADIDKLAEMREQLRTRHDEYWTQQVDIQWQVARAWVAFAEGRHAEGIAALTQAVDAEDATDKAAVSPGPLAPARELLGLMLLEAGRPAEALQALETSMQKEPNRFMAAYAAARAADALGDTDKARRYYQQLLDIVGSDNTQRPALLQARTYLDI